MGKISLSGDEKSLEEIWSWYADQKEALRDFRNKLVASITSTGSRKVNPKFFSLSLEEINTYIKESEKELGHLISFDLISATEALLRSDFYKKVFNKDKTNLGRTFRDIYKKNGNRISLEEDIIENWKKDNPQVKAGFSEFIGLLNYRHWLAHGRYWIPKFGQKYSPENVYGIVEKISEIIERRQTK